MSIFNIFKRKQALSAFGGGDGGSFERAIVINCDNHIVGVQAEYAFIASQCGEPQRDWKLKQQSLQDYNGKPHDVLVVSLANGETRTFYFDISKFFGKV